MIVKKQGDMNMFNSQKSMVHRGTWIAEYVCTSKARMDHVLGLLVHEKTFIATILGHGLN